MKRLVSEAELWAAQAQFGPFGDDVIRKALREWREYEEWKRAHLAEVQE